MTPQEFGLRMVALAFESDDQESMRLAMDKLCVEALRSLGYGGGCDIYEKLCLS